MADDNSPAKPYEEDCGHLQGLLPDFASQADVVLCVKDSDHIIGFPVHKVIISGHSIILSQMLENLQPETLQRQRPSLMMMDDSSSAIRSALACMYRSFPISGSKSQAKSQQISLDDVPDHAKHMKLYDKYNMAKVAEMQTEAFMQPLRTCGSAPTLSSESVCCILHCAAAAEQCGLDGMLALCEAIVTKHFSLFLSHRDLLTSQLPCASMLRVNENRMKMQQQTLDDTTAALKQSTTETTAFLRTVYGVRPKLGHHCKCASCCASIKCPRCDNAMECAYGTNNMRHEGNCGCSRSCTWPNHTIP